MSDTTKRCSKCGEEKSVAEFYPKGKSRPGQFHSYCKACHAQYTVVWQKAHPEKMAEINKKRYYANIEDSRARAREAAKARRDDPVLGPRLVESKRAWEAANKDNKSARDRKSYAKHREKRRFTMRKHYSEHAAEYKARAKAWSRANPEAAVVYHNQRRASEMNTPNTERITRADWKSRKAEYGGRCAYCGATPKRLCMDHVVPLSRGGAHSLDNIVPACLSCNSSKSNKSLLLFLLDRKVA